MSKKGYRQTKQHTENLRQANLGKKRSRLTRWRISQSQTGEKNNNYGKLAWNAGKKLSAEHIRNRTLAQTGLKRTEKTKQKIRKARLHQVLPYHDTLPERLLQQALQVEGIIFEKHKPLFGQPDIFIEPNICIFVDGDYWHTRPKQIERDVLVTDTLEKQNYAVLRFWEHEIHDNLRTCVMCIIEHRS